MSGRGELLTFLKGAEGHRATHNTITVNKNVDVTQSGHIKNTSYELSDLSPPVSDPVIVKEDGQKYIFKNVVQTGDAEAIAETMMVEQV